MDLATLAQFLLPGLTTGCVYALVALGFVLCANVSGVVNFAQGEFVMIGGVIAAWLVDQSVPTAAACALAVLAGAALGAAQERVSLAPIRASPAFIQITVTLGVGVVIRGIALIAFGKDPIGMPGFSGEETFSILGAHLPRQTLWIWGTTAALLAAMYLFLMRTDVGRAVRACSINITAARLMGVDTGRLTLVVFVAAGAMGALAGTVITPIVLADWNAGLDFGLKGFIGAIIGGFRSPALAVAGGLAIGLIEAIATGYIASGSKDVVAYGVLLAYLLIRGGAVARGRRAFAFHSH